MGPAESLGWTRGRCPRPNSASALCGGECLASWRGSRRGGPPGRSGPRPSSATSTGTSQWPWRAARTGGRCGCGTTWTASARRRRRARGGGAEARAGDVAGIVGSDGAEGETPYLRTWNFLDDLPELRRDFNPGAHFADLFKALPESMQPPFEWLFIGPAGSHTRLHVDVWGTDAWLAQLQGLKRFTLFHPAHRKFLERDDGPGGACHWVDLRAPDAELFPDFAQAVAIETVLEPGEVIYLPRKWPHAVDGLTDTVSLTVNFMCPWSKNYVVPLLRKYAERRAMCEKVLGRSLKANDNAMKFCVHGGSIPLEMAKSILGAAGTLGQAGEEEEADDDGVQEGGGGSTTEGGGEGE